MIEVLVTGASLLSLTVFILAFRFAIKEACCPRFHTYEPELPVAELRNASGLVGQRWMRGASKQRLLQGIRLVQAGLVAFGIMSIFIMFLCMAGVVAAMLVSAYGHM